jgi:CubicO group peptidase (beta-lactamase class C family)
VRDVLAASLAAGGDVGAGVCVYVGGRKVVDVWGGAFERDGSGAYGPDTLQNVYSTTKGATAVCVAILADRGLVDYDAKVAEYWPEFAAAGKGDITVAQVMAHQAGLPVTEVVLPLEEVLKWDPVVEALAAQAPLWEPGTAFGYHAITYGYLAGEIVRRVTGTSIGRFFAAEVAGPLGLDFWIGLPEAEEHRVADDPAALAHAGGGRHHGRSAGPGALGGRALMLNDAFLGAKGQMTWNTRRARRRGAAANGITNARSLSRMYAAASARSTAAAPVARDRGAGPHPPHVRPDRCLLREMAFGLGFIVHGGDNPLGGAGPPRARRARVAPGSPTPRRAWPSATS